MVSPGRGSGVVGDTSDVGRSDPWVPQMQVGRAGGGGGQGASPSTASRVLSLPARIAETHSHRI